MQAVIPAGQVLQRSAGALPGQIGGFVLQGPGILGGIDVNFCILEKEGVSRMVHMGVGQNQMGHIRRGIAEAGQPGGEQLFRPEGIDCFRRRVHVGLLLTAAVDEYQSVFLLDEYRPGGCVDGLVRGAALPDQHLFGHVQGTQGQWMNLHRNASSFCVL